MSKTLIQEYNERVATNAVDSLFKAMTHIQRGVYAITAIAMVTSYLHQATTLHAQGAALPFAGLLPLSLDTLMVVLMKVASLKGISNRSRWIARALLLVPAGASGLLNYLGAGSMVLRGMFVFVVAAIVIGEVAQGLIKPDFAALERATESVVAVPAAQVEDEARKAERRAKDRARRAAKRAADKQEAEKKAQRAEAARNRRAAAKVLGEVAEAVEEALGAEAAEELAAA